ncbi:hypothetical protein HPP92_004549 [Vanilla planifolia]|uniref:Protease Do-like 14 n=1 Tax=Vanilla planifolia TaxID=51239 RepID=A0A835RZN1_VANPL|nr:hypothetical protein HPP92_004549 [Vanilla planifolia]
MLRYLASRASGHRKATGLVALAILGGTAVISASFDGNSSSPTRATIALSPPLRGLLYSRSDSLLQGLALPLHFSNPTGGSFSAHPSVEGVVSPGDLKKEEPRGEGDDSRCCPGCLGRHSIANAAAAAGPAVVNISVSRGIHGLFLGKSMGSGTIVDSDGIILTCAHVVVDFEGMRSVSKGKVDVTLQDGREFEGMVISADIHSDIAVVKIKTNAPLPSAKLGSSSRLRPGDWVIAMGCPLSLQNTITAGIVSCVDRKSSDLGLGGVRREYLQTDCAINE